MNKKASLLIKNINKIYTWDETGLQDEILEHAFIAMDHEFILDVKADDYMTLVDANTHVIDAQNYIAIPAFIEAGFMFESNDDMRLMHEKLIRFMMHGTPTIALARTYEQLQSFEYGVVSRKKACDTIQFVIDALRKHEQIKYPCCLSCYDKDIECYNPLLLAQLLVTFHGFSEMDSIKAFTLQPAKVLHLSKQGRIAKGYQGDIILLACESVEKLLSCFSQESVSQIFYKGKRVYPNLIN